MPCRDGRAGRVPRLIDSARVHTGPAMTKKRHDLAIGIIALERSMAGS